MSRPLSMVVSLTAITTVSGLSLGLVNSATRDRIENQVLKHKKLPAVSKVLDKATNDLLADRRNLPQSRGAPGRLLFQGRRPGESKPYAIAFEWKTKGFGGDLVVAIGVDLETDRLTGMAVVTHSETPGVGSRITEAPFTNQFRGMGRDTVFRVKADGGGIDAVSGATISSRAAAKAVDEAYHWYLEHKPEILSALSADAPQAGR